ncbi:MAG: hypothetical protein U0136_12055 [Bdellovibrionota bacterium]
MAGQNPSTNSEPRRATARRDPAPAPTTSLPTPFSAEVARFEASGPAQEAAAAAQQDFIADFQIAHERTMGARYNRESSERDSSSFTGSIVNLFSGGGTTKQIAAEREYEQSCADKERELAARLGKKGVLEAAAIAEAQAQELERRGQTLHASRMRDTSKALAAVAAGLTDDSVGFSDVIKAAETASAKAAELERAGDARGAAQAHVVARDLYQLAPAMLEAPTETHRFIAERVKVATRNLNSGRSEDIALAQREIADANMAVLQWNQKVDPRTGSRPKVSSMPDSSKLSAAYRAASEDFDRAERYLGYAETGIKIAATVAVATVAIAASGAVLPVAALFGTGMIGGTLGGIAGWLAGAAVGVGAGLLVGATAAYGESIGQMIYGLKPWSVSGIFDAQANAQMKEHAYTALSSVAFGKIMQGVGYLWGAAEGLVTTGLSRAVTGTGRLLGSMISTPAKAIYNAMPGFIQLPLRLVGSGFASLGRGAAWCSRVTGVTAAGAKTWGAVTTRFAPATSAAVFSGATVTGISFIDGQHEVNNARSDFVEWFNQHPEIQASLRGPDGKFRERDLWKLEQEFLELNGLTQRDILLKSLRNGGVAGLAAFLHVRLPASTASTPVFERLRREALIQTASIGAGSAAELAHDGKVDGGDVLGVALSSFSGRMIGDGHFKGNQAASNLVNRRWPGATPPIPPPVPAKTPPTLFARAGNFVLWSLAAAPGIAVIQHGVQRTKDHEEERKDRQNRQPNGAAPSHPELVPPTVPFDLPPLQKADDPLHPDALRRVNGSPRDDVAALSSNVKLPRINEDLAERLKRTA